jgi:peptidoglycan hydrolase-like protein with peptidoglycan-binding domain
MLLTGEEAALAAAAQPAFLNGYRRLRPGSSGSAVTRLQKRLIARHGSRISGLRDDGRFGLMTSMGVLLESKRTTREYASPIVISG